MRRLIWLLLTVSLWAQNSSYTVNTVPFSATPVFDARQGTLNKIILTGNVSSSSLAYAAAGQRFTIEWCQDGVGGRTVVWPSNVSGAPTVAATANFCTLADFVYDGQQAITTGQLNGPAGISGATKDQPMVATAANAGASIGGTLYVTALTTGADLCAKINTQVIALTAAGNGGTVDATSITANPQFCNAAIFTAVGQQGITIKLPCTQIYVSVPILLQPTVGTKIIGCTDSNGAINKGTWLIACNASGPRTCGGSANPTFPSGNTLTFSWQHGPFPTGTYAALLEGNMTSSNVGFGEVIQHVYLDCNGLANCFGYLPAIQERSEFSYNHCGDMFGDNTACVFADRMLDSGTQNGPTHFSIRNNDFNTNGSANCNNCYGMVFEGYNTFLGIAQGTCTAQPQGYVTVSGGAVTAGTVTYNGTGACTTGNTCTISSNTGTLATCTANVVGGVISSITINAGGSGYSNGVTGGGPDYVGENTLNGNSGTARLTGGIWLEGYTNPHIGYTHCEFLSGQITTTVANAAETGDCVLYGAGNAFTQSGLIENIDTANQIAGFPVHIGLGTDQSVISCSFDTTLTNSMKDDLTGKTYVQAANSSQPACYSQGTMVSIMSNTVAQVFSKLPTCNAALEGTRAAVTDSTVTTGIIAGGGTNHEPAYCNGTNWVVF